MSGFQWGVTVREGRGFGSSRSWAAAFDEVVEGFGGDLLAGDVPVGAVQRAMVPAC